VYRAFGMSAIGLCTNQSTTHSQGETCRTCSEMYSGSDTPQCQSVIRGADTISVPPGWFMFCEGTDYPSCLMEGGRLRAPPHFQRR
jgi:hypothetical protein